MQNEERKFYTSVSIIKTDLNKNELVQLANEMIESIEELGGRVEDQEGAEEGKQKCLYSYSIKETATLVLKQKTSYYLVIVFSILKKQVGNILPKIRYDLQKRRNVGMVMILSGANSFEIHTINQCKPFLKTNTNTW